VTIEYLVKFSHIKFFEDCVSDFSAFVRLRTEGANANAPRNQGETTKFYEFIDMHVLT